MYVGKQNIINIVSIVILITMIKQNDIIFNHTLTFCPFIIIDNMKMGKPNIANNVSTVVLITMVEQNDIIFNHTLTYCHFVIMDNMYMANQTTQRVVLSFSSQWSNRMISFPIVHIPLVILSSWRICMWVNQNKTKGQYCHCHHKS